MFYRVFLFLLLSTAAFAQDDDVLFLRGLLERGMFESIEFFCADALENVTETKKYQIAEELVRSRTQQLLLAEPKQREVILQSLTELEQRLFAVPSVNPDAGLSLVRLQAQVQCVLAVAALGEEQRNESGLAPDEEMETKMRQGRQTLLTALEKLRQCTEDLNLLQQKISEPELQRQALALSRFIDIHRGRAQRSLALTFPPGSDRTSGLEQAVQVLSGVTNIPSDEPEVLRCRIESATAYRLLNNEEQCRKQLESFAGKTLPQDVRFALEAETLRYRLAINDLDTALRNYGTVPADAVKYPDFQLARLELLLAQNQRLMENDAPQEQQTAQHRAIADLVREIERHSGTYWGRRARMSLVSSPSVQKNGTDANLLKFLAEERYQSGHFSAAVQLFDAASRQAEDNGSTEEAFDNAAAAAAIWDILLKRLKPESDAAVAARLELIQRLCRTAERFPLHSEAEEYYLKGIDLAGQAAKQEAMPLPDYTALLQKYTDTWKDSPKMPPVLLRLAVLRERQGQHNESLAILEKIPALREQFFAVLSADEKKSFQLNKAKQLADEGGVQEAVNILSALLRENKNDLPSLQLLAEILSRQDGEAVLDRAASCWAIIADRSPKNSQRWWTAREGLLNVKLKQGKTDEVRKDFELLRTLYPELGGKERKERLMRFEN